MNIPIIDQAVNYLREHVGSPSDEKIEEKRENFLKLKKKAADADFKRERTKLEARINILFPKTKKGNNKVKEELGILLDNYYSLMENHGVEMEGSPGMEGGTDTILEVRSKVLEDLALARDIITINEMVGESLPGSVVFTDIVSSENLIYLLAENFHGQKLNKAPYKIMENHVRNCVRLSKIDIVNEIGEWKYEKDNFTGKIGESLDTIEKSGFKIRDDTRISLEGIYSLYEDNSTNAYWDTRYPNQKFNEKGEIKYFDWGKTARFLVTPFYEVVQAILSYGKYIDNMKDVARREYNEINDFDVFWEAGTLYFLSRRLHYSIKEDKERDFIKYRNLLLAENFKIFEAGRLLQKDLEL